METVTITVAREVAENWLDVCAEETKYTWKDLEDDGKTTPERLEQRSRAWEAAQQELERVLNVPEATPQIVAEIFQRYSEGEQLDSIVRWLNR